MRHAPAETAPVAVRSSWPVLAAAALPLCWLACAQANRAAPRLEPPRRPAAQQIESEEQSARIPEGRARPVQDPFATDPPSAAREPESVLEGRAALERLVSFLDEGVGWLASLPGYSAVLCRQERIRDELRAPEEIRLKIRHEPFSVYMKWTAGDVGRELLYVDGENDGRMLVRVGGWKSRLVPPLWIDPFGDRAADASRYPVTEAGLLAVARQLAVDRRNDLLRPDPVSCSLVPGRMWNDRPCWLAEVSFDRPGVCRNYRKSVVYVDRTWRVPLCIRNYEWPPTLAASVLSGAPHLSPGAADVDGGACTDVADLDSLTLVESYDFRDFAPQRAFAPHDFDRNNDQYRLRR